MTLMRQTSDILKKIKYPPFDETGGDDEFYHICVKYLCKHFETHIIFKVGLMINERGGSTAMHKCLNQLQTLATNQMKKYKLSEEEQKEVVQQVKQTVSQVWKTIGSESRPFLTLQRGCGRIGTTLSVPAMAGFRKTT